MKLPFHDLAVNARIVMGFELRATVQIAAGRPDLAAGFLQLAADVASRNHPGWFVSPAMESLIAELGEVFDADIAGMDPAGPVVHVLGGEAGRLVNEARAWWQLDPTARLLALPEHGEGPLAAASTLRDQLDGVSMVVLHGSGAAVAPLIALAGWARRPPVVMVEPATLGFWAGTGVVDAVVHQSSAAMALASERRCLPEGRSVLVEHHERAAPEVLAEVLAELRDRIVAWPTPRPPTALLPAVPSMIDQRVLARQIELELTDGAAGALRRWSVPREITDRPGWVVLGREPERVVGTIRGLLAEEPAVFPDIVVVDQSGNGHLQHLGSELAGVVELVETGSPLDPEDAAVLGTRQLVSDEVLVVSDRAAPDGSLLKSLQLGLRSGFDAVCVGGLPEGELLALRRHPRHAGWPAAISLDHPAVSGRLLEMAESFAEGTYVRESMEITESRGELFHTESEVPQGPSEPDE